MFKEELSNFICYDNSIYHAIKGNKYGVTRLEDIRNYLLSCKNYKTSKYKIWPKYINDLLRKIKNTEK